MPFAMILFIFVLIWPWNPVSARVYQYTDKEGVVHFTDNLSEIPYDQLPSVESRGKKKMDPEGSDEGSQEEVSPPEAESRREEGAESTKDGGQDTAIPIVEEMNTEKAALDAEHARLMKRREALKKERDTLTTPEQVRAYQKRVKALNKEIESYQERNRAFRKKVDAYNQALKEKDEK